MPINDRNLKPGTRLVGKYHKQTYTCEVVEVEGKLKFRLQDGREFKSPSAAGMAITGKSCNGWAFWSVQDAQAATATEKAENQPTTENPAPAETATEQTAVPVDAEADASAAVAATEPGASQQPNHIRNRIFRVPNQKGTPEGQTKWYCEACMASFLAPTGETPTTCPKGHRAG